MISIGLILKILTLNIMLNPLVKKHLIMQELEKF
jgi:hypothetical protein